MHACVGMSVLVCQCVCLCKGVSLVWVCLCLGVHVWGTQREALEGGQRERHSSKIADLFTPLPPCGVTKNKANRRQWSPGAAKTGKTSSHRDTRALQTEITASPGALPGWAVPGAPEPSCHHLFYSVGFPCLQLFHLPKRKKSFLEKLAHTFWRGFRQVTLMLPVFAHFETRSSKNGGPPSGWNEHTQALRGHRVNNVSGPWPRGALGLMVSKSASHLNS